MLKIPRTIKILGWVSFFTDVSSEMILPILPLFLKKVLQSTMTSIGIIEGVAEATASLLKVASGW
ncbi:MFS transporter, partial [candidate division KSB1 bacterium]